MDWIGQNIVVLDLGEIENLRYPGFEKQNYSSKFAINKLQ